MKKYLQKRIDDFLAAKKKKKGTGWPEVTPGEISDLHDIIHALIKTKYQRDIDGDLPVKVWITDKTRHSSIHADYGHEPNVDDLRLLSMVAQEASRKVALELRYLKLEKS